MASASDPASKGKQITNPRRLLILSPPTQSTSIIPPLLHSLTGIPIETPLQTEVPLPSNTDADTDTPTTTPTTSFAGYTTHSPLQLNTKYYTAEVPIWVDEVPLSTENQWRTEFSSDEAEEVRDAVGSLLVAVRNPVENDASPGSDPGSREDVSALLDLMRDIGAVKEKIDEDRGGVGDVAGVFVLVGASKRKPAAAPAGGNNELGDLEGDIEGDGEEALTAGWWEDQLFDAGLVGWEVIEWDPKADGGEKTRNKFGEYEGMPRIKEVLETHDWSGSSSNDQDPDSEFDDDDLETELLGYSRSEHTPGFGHEVQELEREMFGLRMAIERGGGDGDEPEEEEEEEEEEENKVESMEALMMRVQAIRDMGADLPEAERKKFAAKAVNDLMREL